MPMLPETPDEPEGAPVSPAAIRRVINMVVESLTAQVDEPYVLVLRTAYSTHYSGPFPDGMTALLAMEEELRANAGLPEDERVAVTMAPLVPWRLARTIYDAP
ncbi:hypothetical protein ABFU82_14650 [Nocardioides sp. WV_118_6]|uniref:hypothetical protein n=1 Tax=Pimelobacter TaxID=2044 RepID=UPI00207B9E78|nr:MULTISPECIES: hypothetical protein [Pimelobacter]UUW89936.1 hypothetical protein M0M43_00195 [Pimelobacter simplex]UUW93765.1 hypothetical protein M0M48_18705 [Pimelobacter simplex]